jgi:hypothetical protein
MIAIRRLLKGSRVSDEDRASKIIAQCLPSERFKHAAAVLREDALRLRTTRSVYKLLCKRACALSASAQSELDELLEIVEHNADDVVRFLKYHCWFYRRLLLAEVVGYLTDVDSEFEQFAGLGDERSLA